MALPQPGVRTQHRVASQVHQSSSGPCILYRKQTSSQWQHHHSQEFLRCAAGVASGFAPLLLKGKRGWYRRVARASSTSSDVEVVDTNTDRGKVLKLLAADGARAGETLCEDAVLISMVAGQDFEVMLQPDGAVAGLRHRDYISAVLGKFALLPESRKKELLELYCPDVPSVYLQKLCGENGSILSEKAAELGIEAELASRVMRIFNCNAQTQFSPTGDVIDTLSLSALQSRLNHSCDPNVIALPGEAGKLRVVALRRIAQGEELCQSYLQDEELAAPARPRQEKLARVWGFDCKCERCAAAADTALPSICEQFEVALNKSSGESLGLDIIYNEEQAELGILIRAVLPDGLASDWNARVPAPLHLAAGDSIVAVNGQQGDIAMMLSELSRAGSLELHVRRSVWSPLGESS